MQDTVTRRHYEYRVIPRGGYGEAEMEEAFKVLGRDGWRLVQTVVASGHTSMFIFERECSETSIGEFPPDMAMDDRGVRPWTARARGRTPDA